jgi:retron-type reverse transcriptase
MDELSKRLGIDANLLTSLRPQYATFNIPKRSGGIRQILAPVEELKKLQKLILRRILGRLKAHDAAHGFERGRSIVTNARVHVGREIVLRMDLKEFFTSTRDTRVEQYFRTIGWDQTCAALLTKLCTHDGGLPQGAPTSPRLSNLLNTRLDARLTKLAAAHRAIYTRYADDLTFSFEANPEVQTKRLANTVISFVKQILQQEGYQLHLHAKLKIQRRHDRQRVTGLVVNQKVQLPRDTRRWLRAVEHHHKTGKPSTLTRQQLQGWRSFSAMIEEQRVKL